MQKDDELGKRLGGVRVCKGCETIRSGKFYYSKLKLFIYSSLTATILLLLSIVKRMISINSIKADCDEILWKTHTACRRRAILIYILTPGAARGPVFTGMAMVPTSIPSSARKYGELRKLRDMLRNRIGSSLLVALAPRCENGGRSATCSTLPSTSGREMQ